MPNATASRLMQFSAGPEQHRFYACPECMDWLQNGPDLFRPIKGKELEPVDPEDEIECDGCREGGDWYEPNPRQKGDDDGVEYGHPRDRRDGYE